MKHLTSKHSPHPKSQQANKKLPLACFHIIGLPPPPTSQTEGESERQERKTQKEKQKDDVLGSTLLYFVNFDFEMRLENTRINEEK